MPYQRHWFNFTLDDGEIGDPVLYDRAVEQLRRRSHSVAIVHPNK